MKTRTGFSELPGRVTFPGGLDASRSYRVEAIFPAPGDADYGHTFTEQSRRRGWRPGADASGRFLGEVGLPMPVLNPEHAILLRFTTL